MYDRTGQRRDIACLAADLLVVAGLRLRGPERGRGLPHRYQRGVRGDADDTVGAAGWWPWHRGHLTSAGAGCGSDGLFRGRGLFGWRRWWRRRSGHGDRARLRWRRRRRGRERRSRNLWRWRRGVHTGRHGRRLGGRVGGLRRDDRRDDGAVRVAVEQAAVLIAHHIISAGKQRGESRIRGDAGVDEPYRHARAGGVFPRLGDIKHDVARRRLGDIGIRDGQRVGAGVLLLHLLVGTGRIVRRQGRRVDAGRVDGHRSRRHHHVGAEQQGSHCRRRCGPRCAGQASHQ